MRRFIRGFYFAWLGVLYVLKNERNARVHLLFAIGAMALGLVLKLSNAELAAIFFAIVIVFVAEVTNSALEKTLDLIDRDHNPQIAIIKDMAAGAVLVAAAGAFAIGLVIFGPALFGRGW